MSSTCDRNRSRMEEAAWGRLDEASRTALLDHTGQCPACDGELAFMERLRAERDTQVRALPPPVYFEGVLAEIHARMPRTPQVREPRRIRLTRESFASGLMAALALIWFGFGIASNRTTKEMPAPLGLGVGVTEAVAAPKRIAGVPQPDDLVLVRGLGWVRRDSELLRLSRREMIDLGLVPAELARG